MTVHAKHANTFYPAVFEAAQTPKQNACNMMLRISEISRQLSSHYRPNISRPIAPRFFYLLILLFLPLTHSVSHATSVTVTINSDQQQELPDLTGSVVYLTPTNGTQIKNSQINLKPIHVKQQGLLFKPYIQVIQTGSRVNFPNLDKVSHHVYSFSATKSFELPLYKDSGDQSPSVVFDKAGLITLGCNIHDWMLGYILVVDTPYYTQLAGNTATISNVVAGEYELRFWSPGMHRKEKATKTVSVDSHDQQLQLTLQYSVRKLTEPSPPSSDGFGGFTYD